MKVYICHSIISFLLLLAFSVLVSAHPGDTASDGCHYCWTNCDKWGVPEGIRHCHSRVNTENINSSIYSINRSASVFKSQPKTNQPMTTATHPVLRQGTDSPWGSNNSWNNSLRQGADSPWGPNNPWNNK